MKGIHRATPDSLMGRRMTSAKGSRIVTGPTTLTRSQIEWNRQLEDAKAIRERPFDIKDFKR